ncbi:MAG: HsmA family protein [Patescibacteria group bacterium]|jgi:uncharacterized repeat protein (TIGR03987 family)
MFWAVLFMILALMFYTTAIWSEKIKHHLERWMIIIFCLGFADDLIGTTIMRLSARTHQLDFHKCCGYAALIIMLLHLIWALRAYFKGGKPAHLFHKYSIYAWCAWLIAFFTGIPK